MLLISGKAERRQYSSLLKGNFNGKGICLNSPYLLAPINFLTRKKLGTYKT